MAWSLVRFLIAALVTPVGGFILQTPKKGPIIGAVMGPLVWPGIGSQDGTVIRTLFRASEGPVIRSVIGLLIGTVIW